MNAAELRQLTDEELKAKLDEAYKQLWSLRFQHASRQLKDTSQIRQTKRLIARIKTILHERRLAEEKEG
ncbi:MAG: 50S ribosomal protein L29 [Ardenticatenia bacterium]|uniref:Large ribosomal subunit protein uL29 n=1 Tax=Ardenticatena maritima TaxID=872965 RepID=A0A0M8K560_9CHLR|nr:50S ribosomal protein L29 [Ardenticatena maritima]KPL90034.1 50S ribosomal protein L29 [Ardenticatena maritima]RME10471.1 MAG: 50S ribosomal protein L29 [Ardenticatenia bacterium]GAP61903.1 large subunit ribosomal protein L29 [Ardenticatena maritima]